MAETLDVSIDEVEMWVVNTITSKLIDAKMDQLQKVRPVAAMECYECMIRSCCVCYNFTNPSPRQPSPPPPLVNLHMHALHHANC